MVQHKVIITDGALAMFLSTVLVTAQDPENEVCNCFIEELGHVKKDPQRWRVLMSIVYVVCNAWICAIHGLRYVCTIPGLYKLQVACVWVVVNCTAIVAQKDNERQS